MLTKYAEGLLDEPLPEYISMLLQDLATADAADAADIQHRKNEWETTTFSDRESKL